MSTLKTTEFPLSPDISDRERLEAISLTLIMEGTAQVKVEFIKRYLIPMELKIA